VLAVEPHDVRTTTLELSAQGILEFVERLANHRALRRHSSPKKIKISYYYGDDDDDDDAEGGGVEVFDVMSCER